MDRENIIIEEKALSDAQKIGALVSNADKKDIAIANALGAKIAGSFFDSNIYQIDTESGLHNIPNVLEDYLISDIYINNSYIDVRLYFSDEEICVPIEHFENNILPVAYMFIKLDSSLQHGTVTGFMKPESIDKNNTDGKFYFINECSLESIYDIETRLKTVLDTEDVSVQLLYDYLDNSLPKEEKNNLLRLLISSRSSRLKFIKIYNGQTALRYTANNYTENQETSVEEDLDEIFESDNIEIETVDDNTEFYTEITPSHDDIIAGIDNLEENLNSQEETFENNEEIIKDESSASSEENIEALFDTEQKVVTIKNKKSPLGFILFLLIVISTGGIYWWYANIYNKPETLDYNLQDTPAAESNQVTSNNNNEPMPNETVENEVNPNKEEESSSISLPAVEQSLDASVIVANLKVDWEVPAGYISNTSAKHYLLKLGKIIQLNLKTELLLLQKPPLANKITVELTFNTNSGKFELVGIKDSSGEKTVDDTILQTVKEALNTNIGSNSEWFSKIQGNPILVIHL